MRVRPGMVLATLMTASLFVASASPMSAQPSVESFYAGKTITILIGFPPGGTYDIYARMTASHFSRFMPGRPTIQVQSRPGGSGIGAVNYFNYKLTDKLLGVIRAEVFEDSEGVRTGFKGTYTEATAGMTQS